VQSALLFSHILFLDMCCFYTLKINDCYDIIKVQVEANYWQWRPSEESYSLQQWTVTLQTWINILYKTVISHLSGLVHNKLVALWYTFTL
jgi:hypothetical protein